jgi:hypothetical protein
MADRACALLDGIQDEQSFEQIEDYIVSSGTVDAKAMYPITGRTYRRRESRLRSGLRTSHTLARPMSVIYSLVPKITPSTIFTANARTCTATRARKISARPTKSYVRSILCYDVTVSMWNCAINGARPDLSSSAGSHIAKVSDMTSGLDVMGRE